MALAQEVHQDCKYDEQYLLRQSLEPLQSRLTYVPEATATDQFSNFTGCTGMPQSMMEIHYLPTQPWAPQQVEQEEVKPTAAAPTTSSSNIFTYSSCQDWSRSSTDLLDWHHALRQNQPYIVASSDPQFHQNHALTYDPSAAAQNTIGKGFGGQMAWPSPGLSGLPRGMAADSSVLDTSMSPSPKSYLSDEFETTYSPASMLDQASPCGNWNASPATANNAAIPLSSCRSFITQDSDGNIGYSELSRTGTNTAMAMVPSSYSSRRDQVPIAPFAHEQRSRPEYPASNTGHSLWYGSNYAYDASSLAFRTRDVVSYKASNSDSSFSSTDEASSSQPRSAPWSTSDPNAHPQSRTQDTFQVQRSAGAQAQREHNDQLLIDGKRRGETYKEIKLKMVGEKPAESTLRGRYRSLTKARKDRVRKPVWTSIDLDLLDEIVQLEFERIKTSLQNPYSLSFEQKILKVAWKKVAEYIADNGGSYHFGNATCKRKWLERNQGRK